MRYCINNYDINKFDNSCYDCWSHNGQWKNLSTCKAIINDWPSSRKNRIFVLSEESRPFKKIKVEGNKITCIKEDNTVVELTKEIKENSILVLRIRRKLFRKVYEWYSVEDK